MEGYDPELFWLVLVSFIVAFILSFGIGANDVANSFGTSVGAKVITVKTACIVATIFEILGAVLIGSKVSDTMRKIIQENLYVGSEKELMFGYLSALGGSGIWLLLATFFKLPISGTHSIVGATVGFSLVTRGFISLHWMTFVGIVTSWFISPVLSGIISVILFLLIGKFIVNSRYSVRNGLRTLPFFYGITVAINIFSVVHGGSKVLHLYNVPLWAAFVSSSLIGTVTAGIVYLFVVPRQHVKMILSTPGEKQIDDLYDDDEYIKDNIPVNGKSDLRGTKKNQFHLSFEKINGEEKSNKVVKTNSDSQKFLQNRNSSNKCSDQGLKQSFSDVPLIKTASVSLENDIFKDKDDCEMKRKADERANVESIFAFLQILTAIFGSFAHGGNDVSNAIGPLVALWLVYAEGTAIPKSETPLFILLFGGIGISVGLCAWGRRVIKTIGEDLTKITPSTGFSIEIGASLTVLLATKIGVPISTTHCKVGSVVFVGCINSSKGGVDWKLFRNIIYAWVVTVPVAALLSATIMFLLHTFLL